jgi:acyl-CoA thioester hydrolase
MIAPMTRIPPGTRADYHHFLPVTTRWMDNDVFGHLNNVVYYSFFDTAVTHSLMDSGILTWKGSDHFLVVAESGCRYHAEAAFPEAITAGIRVARLGDSSIRHEIGVFAGDNGRASAEGFMVHVCVDAATRRPAPLPGAWREALQQLMRS